MKNIVFLILGSMLLFSCKEEDSNALPAQPDFIQTSLSNTLTVEGNVDFELFVPEDNPNLTYEWTVPESLTIVEGQGTSKIVVRGDINGATIPVKSIGVKAVGNGSSSIVRWFYKEIVVVIPPPSLANYKTKRYGAKTWMIENLNEDGEDGNLGWMYDNNVDKANAYGRLYTWAEAMTGISKCTAEQNPYKFGYTGTDDMGNPFKLDGVIANAANVQIRGACPEGWHIANANDWYDLLVAIKTEYNIPGTTLAQVGSLKDGYIIGWGRETSVMTSITLTNWGLVGAYLRGTKSKAQGGYWDGAEVFNYTGNANFPAGNYPLYKDLSDQIEFKILPTGRWNNGSNKFEQDGIYSYHWLPFLVSNSPNNPFRVTIGNANVNFSNGAESWANGYCIRCVANY